MAQPGRYPTRTLGGFDFQELQFGGDVLTHQPAYPLPYFTYVIHGGYSEKTSNGDFVRTRGTAHYHHANDYHSGRIGREGARCLSVMASPDRLSELGPDVDWTSPLCVSGFPEIDFIARKVSDAFVRDDRRSNLLLEALATQAFIAFAEARRHSIIPAWIARATTYLANRMDTNPTADSLSHISNLHPTHTLRAFRRFVGCTPTEYVQRERLAIACRLLEEGSQSIGVIAAELGYSDQSHFTRRFRQGTGLTPKQFRERR